MCNTCEESYDYAEGYSTGEEDSWCMGWVGLTGLSACFIFGFVYSACVLMLYEYTLCGVSGLAGFAFWGFLWKR